MHADQTNLPTVDLVLDLDGTGPRHVVLERALRDAVRSGRLPAGSALPPSRALAATLGVSRWVVTEAYAQLVAEGTLTARVGSATRVAPGHPPRRAQEARPATRPRLPPPAADTAPAPRRAHDLAPGVPDLRHFPRAAWTRATRDALRDAPDADLAAVPPAGHPALRAALLTHLAAARGVVADDLVVTSGAADGMARLARALVAAGHRTLLVEDPSWPRLRDVAAAAGLTPVPVPVDGDGADVGALRALAERTGARVALVTPAHQFPCGVALAPPRRDALVRWAHDVDGLVVEDDYDAEFRYDRRPVAALQAPAPERVALLGSLSKTLGPAVGVGWLVVPAAWRAGVAQGAAPPSTLTQLTVLHLLTSGAYARHLRAARTRYARRRRALLAALTHHLPDAQVTGLSAGLHVVLTLPAGVAAPDLVAAAAARGVTVADAARYAVDASVAAATTLVLGYGNLADARVEAAVVRLADAVHEVRG